MKTVTFALLLFITSGNINAQINLVPNPSFEDTIPYESPYDGLENYTPNWKGGLGYFNALHSGSYGGVPTNICGFQNPRTGNAYCGIYNYLKNSYPIRQYIRTKLLQKLQNNKKYKVSFYVSLGDAMHANTNSIGAYFGIDSSYVINNYVFDVIPQILNSIHNDLSSKTNWTLVCDSFVANGTERWITIGNFYNDSLSNITPLDSVCSMPNGFNCGSYYYIDDVSVELVDETGISPTNLPKREAFKVVPNPSNGSFVISINGILNTQTTLKITDVYGKQIDEIAIVNTTTNYENTSLSNGLYFYTITSKDEEIGRGKIIVQK